MSVKQFLAFFSSDAVDMALKIAVVEQLCENVLHKSRNGAGIEAELLFVYADKMLGQHHVSNT